MSDIQTVDNLTPFLDRKNIVIQCHNYPDADAIGSAFALYSFFTAKGVDCRIVYGGSAAISKINLRLFVEKLHIPVEHISEEFRVDGLLITVDCQYLSSNIVHFPADEVLMIDHHRQGENIDKIRNSGIVCYSCIKEQYGSCASVIYQLLQKSDFAPDLSMSTALYYGLYMDTNEFSEVRHPADRETRDELIFDDGIFTLLKNSNLSPKELKQAGASMQNFDARGQLAVLESVECDPNVLGMIADILIRVENITTAIVFNKIHDYDFVDQPNYKFSVRTCVGEVRANELAQMIASPMVDGVHIGGGGGHRLKSGGRVDAGLFQKYLDNTSQQITFNEYLYRVFDEYSSAARIIYSDNYDFAELSALAGVYETSQYVLGYICTTEITSAGNYLLIRSRYGDIRAKVSPDLYILAGIRGDLACIEGSEFKEKYCDSDLPLYYAEFSKYDEPRVLIDHSGKKIYLKEMLHSCTLRRPQRVLAVPVSRIGTPVKLMDSKWANADFRFGNVNDYLVINEKNHADISIVEGGRFREMYRRIS